MEGFKYIIFSILITISGAINLLAQDSVKIDNIQLAQNVLDERNEVFFKFYVDSREVLDQLTLFISIDSYNSETGEVLAYANSNEFKSFLGFNIDFEVLKSPSLVDFEVEMLTLEDFKSKGFTDTWDSYPTYEAYEALMYQFQTDYPDLCKIHNIGTMASGRSLLFAQISANVNQKEAEPRFMYTSTIHGDETTGYVLMLRLIHYLLNNYTTDTEIAYLVDNLDIWICPNENPDGTYYGGNHTVSGARRFNAYGYDLNRNYPNPVSASSNQQYETLAMMGLTDTLKFVMSINMHGGAEVVNFPWDSWYSSTKTHADHNWWYFVSREYADTARFYSPSTYLSGFDDGVSHGGDWYVIYGGRQDYMGYFKHGREVTLEISNTKLLPASSLPAHWNYNYRSFLNYMRQALYGVRGIIKDGLTDEPIVAKVEVLSHDKDNSHVFSMLPNGNYHRPLLAGTYDLQFSAEGYNYLTVSNVNIDNYQTVNLDVTLYPLSQFPAPTNLEYEIINLNDIVLTWDAPPPSSPMVLDRYKIYRNGIYFAQTSALTYTDSNLGAGDYNYTVTAFYTNPEWESVQSNSANVNLSYFVITASADENGSIDPSGSISITSGANQIFSITPIENFHIYDVLVNNVSVGTPTSYQFTNVSANHTIHAKFTGNVHSISATPNNISFGVASGSGTYNHGEEVTLIAQPYDSYRFENWTEDDIEVSTESVYSFTALADRNLVANFTPIIHTITTNVVGNGSISPSGEVEVMHGANQLFTITPNPDNYISYVNTDGISVGCPNSYTFYSVKYEHNIEVSFVDVQPTYHTLTITSNDKGIVSPTGELNVVEGNNATINILPNTSYHIGDVLLDGESVMDDVYISSNRSGTYTLYNVTSAHSLEVRFDIDIYTITSTAAENGTINPSGEIEVEHGANQLFSITADEYFHISEVLVDYVNVGAVSNYYFENVRTSHIIDVNFEPNKVIIVASAGQWGSISPNGNVLVNQGSSPTFTILPDAGAFILDVLVDGESVGAVDSYTFENVTTNRIIEAFFALNTYNITATAGDNGNITPSGEITVNHGSNLAFSITPDENYMILDVLVDGQSKGAVSTYIFTSINADHTIDAIFSLKTYTITATTEGGGNISPEGNITMEHGEDQTFTISPTEGYHISDVLVDGISVGVVSTFSFENITSNHSIHVVFQINTYTISATASENGSIEPAGEITKYFGDSQTYAITPDTEYHIEDVLVNGGSVGPVTSYTFSNISADGTIHATFAINTYTITINLEGNGTVSINETEYQNPQTYDYGTSLYLLAVPDTEWRFIEWSNDLLGDENPATIMLTTNKDITATFSPNVDADNHLLSNVKVFPNPFSSSINLRNASDIHRVIISNLLGEEVLAIDTNESSELSIHTDKLSVGAYIIILRTRDGLLIMEKMVKTP